MKNAISFLVLWIFGVILGMNGVIYHIENNVTIGFVLLTGAVIIICIEEVKKQ